MVVITDRLLRSRAEHNDGDLVNLEEISLNSLGIEKIEVIDKICKKLKIVHLTDNVLQDTSPLKKFKELEYLNVAMNNISEIHPDSFTGLENLTRLDMTLNFIGDNFLKSLEILKGVQSLKEIYLTGNPCTKFENYRDYVINFLPQIETLDGLFIGKSDRIKAKQITITKTIHEEQNRYKEKREMEKIEHGKIISENYDYFVDTKIDLNTRRTKFYESKTSHSPEFRLQTARLEEIFEQEENQNKQRDYFESDENEAPRRLFKSGVALNINQLKWNFNYDDNDDINVKVELLLPKHIDIHELDLLVEPAFIRITKNEKIFQLRLLEEIKSDSSKAERSIATGHLLLTLPKVKTTIKQLRQHSRTKKNDESTNVKKETYYNYLEINDSLNPRPDYKNIVNNDIPPPLEYEQDD